MLSKIPINLSGIPNDEINREVLRTGIIAELDAINLYEQMAALSTDSRIKTVLLDIANEEKTHVGEFLTLLLKLDKAQIDELEKGKQEVSELTD